MERDKLETAIEREAFKYVESLKEHMYDFTMIYIGRHQSPVDPKQAEIILNIAKSALEDGMLSKIDFFKKGIEGALTQFTEAENPLQPGKPLKKARE